MSYPDVADTRVLAKVGVGEDLAAGPLALMGKLRLCGVSTAGDARVAWCGSIAGATASSLLVVQQLVLGELAAPAPLFADIASDATQCQPLQAIFHVWQVALLLRNVDLLTD